MTYQEHDEHNTAAPEKETRAKEGVTGPELIWSSPPLILTPPLDRSVVEALRAGQRVLFRGVLYTARDAAHRRLVEALQRGEAPPFPLEGAVLYYTGPAPAPEGWAIGPAGPTTSGRMDPYTPFLLARGVRGMIGKGRRSPAVKRSLQECGAVYFAATGGAAVLLARRILRAEVVAYPDLGPEAIYRLEVLDLPVVVVNDVHGGDLYEEGMARYKVK